MAEPTFDRTRFAARLHTRRLGRTLIVRGEVGSTNDAAWEALEAGAPDGAVVVADAQTRGRGRAGRRWHLAPGTGLALSLLLSAGPDRRRLATLPLVAGLALALALDGFGLRARLKWPNDLLAGGRKLAGVLAESRRLASPGADGRDAAVLGVGVNVSATEADFPPELRGRATSLAIEGVDADREGVAAAFLDTLESLWDEHLKGAPSPVLDAWRRRADFWGRAVRVHTPSGALDGLASRLDDDGALVLTLADGRETAVLAGDLELETGGEGRP